MALHLKLLLAAVFWGTTPAAGRMLADYGAPFVLVFGRFLVAGFALALVLWWRGEGLGFPRRLWVRLAVLGATGIALHNGLMFKGLESTEASTASILLGGIAIQVLILDSLRLRRLPERWACAGVALAFLGTALVMTGGSLGAIFEMGFGRGEALILLSALCWALYSVLGRRVLELHSPLRVTAAAVWMGVLFLLPFPLARPGVAVEVFRDPVAIAFVLALGVVGSALGFLWYFQAVERHGAVVAALYLNLVPIFGLASASLLVGETLPPTLLVGAAAVLLGVLLVNPPPPIAARFGGALTPAEGERASPQ